jgi:hypothetical protein
VRLPVTTSLPGGDRIVLRTAVRGDVPALVSLIAADQLGSGRDGIEDADDLAAYSASARPRTQPGRLSSRRQRGGRGRSASRDPARSASQSPAMIRTASST